MIKAKLNDNTLILGLSSINVEKLKQGMPIRFDGRPYGYPGNIVIVYGETEVTIAQDLFNASGTDKKDVIFHVEKNDSEL
jgi:hypothetical protein